MALGEILKNARVQRGLTPSDVAESTHLMVQVVEDLEREDFRRVAAPIYGRGFIKLYAELMELDPEPLIRDFMDLYMGARAPAVRTRKPEAQPESGAEAVPVTRTVTGTAPLSPPRQAVQPRPAVRPLSAPQPAACAAPAAGASDLAPAVCGEAPAATFAVQPQAPESGGGRVVESEAEESAADEPDLFRPQSRRRKSYASGLHEDGARGEEEAAEACKPRLPIFKVGGRMAETHGAEAQDDASHARRTARIQAFVNGVTKLKEGVERKLPAAVPHKLLWILGGAGLAMLVALAFGIHLLFKMTGSTVKPTAAAVVKSVAPAPDLYVD